MSKSDLHIDILGTSIAISADEEPEYLKAILDNYRQAVENVQRRTGLKDPLKVAVLTGYLLSDELEKAGRPDPNNREPIEAEQLTLGMISRLEEIIGPLEPKADNNVIKLQSTVKNYDWGSTEWLPAFLGQKNISRIPWAELWLQVNPSGPNYGKLPLLLKILAAEKPLSIQVHPNLKQARDGFERENLEGIPLDAHNRNYRDSNKKEEIICALSPFVALCGFRRQWEIIVLMEIISKTSAESDWILKAYTDRLVTALKEENNPGTFLEELYSISGEIIKTLALAIKKQMNLLKADYPEYKDVWDLCVYLSTLFPEDPGILAPLFLNIIELAPGEAVYIPAGIFHSYIKGMGVELMTDSDNVLRGGLTAKFVDTEEVLKVLDFSGYKPQILQAPDSASMWYSYQVPTEDFSLSVMRGTGDTVSYPESDPAMLLVTEGCIIFTENDMTVSKGEAVFVPAGKRPVLSGTFTAYIASAAPGRSGLPDDS